MLDEFWLQGGPAILKTVSEQRLQPLVQSLKPPLARCSRNKIELQVDYMNLGMCANS